MKLNILHVIEKYSQSIELDEFHRYKSWDICHKSFNVSKQTDNHILQLAFYLASWGMYRGSGGLLQKNHLIHSKTVDIIFNKKHQKLKCHVNNDVSKENIVEIITLKNELANHYKNIFFTKGIDPRKSISPTDTLLSKIMLGTLACVPAYDRYFVDGLKEMKIEHTGFNEASLNELFKVIDKNKKEIDKAQKLIKSKTGNHYPIMKIIDMYFWQIGYDKEMDEKLNKKN